MLFFYESFIFGNILKIRKFLVGSITTVSIKRKMRSISTIVVLKYLIFAAYRTCDASIDYSSVREEDSLFLKAKHNIEVYKDNQTVGWAYSFQTGIPGKCAGSCHNHAQCRSKHPHITKILAFVSYRTSTDYHRTRILLLHHRKTTSNSLRREDHL